MIAFDEQWQADRWQFGRIMTEAFPEFALGWKIWPSEPGAVTRALWTTIADTYDTDQVVYYVVRPQHAMMQSFLSDDPMALHPVREACHTVLTVIKLRNDGEPISWMSVASAVDRLAQAWDSVLGG